MDMAYGLAAGTAATRLVEARPGGGFRVVTVEALADQARRLAELGLRPGRRVEVVHNHGADGVVVGLGDERLALPPALARSIVVAEEGELAP